jgi:hypothetical protein
MAAKLVPTFADRGYRVVSATDPHGCILSFPDRSRYYFFQVAPQLYSQGWVDPIPDPLLLRKSGSAGNRTWDLWICSQELWPLEHRGSSWIRIEYFVYSFALLFLEQNWYKQHRWGAKLVAFHCGALGSVPRDCSEIHGWQSFFFPWGPADSQLLIVIHPLLHIYLSSSPWVVQ